MGLSEIYFSDDDCKYGVFVKNINFHIISRVFDYRLRRVVDKDVKDGLVMLRNDKKLQFEHKFNREDLRQFFIQPKLKPLSEIHYTSDREFHQLFPSGRVKFNHRARFLANLLEVKPEIFQVAEHENHDYSWLTCNGIDTDHKYFEEFNQVKILVDNSISNPLKSIINVEVL